MASMGDLQRTAWALNPFGEMGDPKTMAAVAALTGESEKATAMENAAIAGAEGHVGAAEQAKEGALGSADLAAGAHKYGADQGLIGEKTKANAHVTAADIASAGHNKLLTSQATAQDLANAATKKDQAAKEYRTGAYNLLGVAGNPVDYWAKNPELKALYDTHAPTGDLNALGQAHTGYQHNKYAPEILSQPQFSSMDPAKKAYILGGSPDAVKGFAPQIQNYLKSQKQPAAPAPIWGAEGAPIG